MPDDLASNEDIIWTLRDDKTFAIDFEEPADWWKNDMIVDKQPVEPVVWREEPEEVFKADVEIEIYPLLL